MSRPSTRATPVVGVSKFRRHLMNVLLPAPLGPRRPIVPGGTFTVTFESACCAPYVFPKFSVSMINSPAIWFGVCGGGEEVRSACNAWKSGVVQYPERRVEVTEQF